MVKFEEIQKINNFIKVVIALLVIGFFALSIKVDAVFMIGAINGLIFLIIFMFLKFKVSVFNDRIEYRLSPFHQSNHVIMIDDIIKIDQVHPNRLGIWGMKIKRTPSGSFYYIGGNKIIRIKTNQGKVIVIGISKIQELEDVFKCVGLL